VGLGSIPVGCVSGGATTDPVAGSVIGTPDEVEADPPTVVSDGSLVVEAF